MRFVIPQPLPIYEIQPLLPGTPNPLGLWGGVYERNAHELRCVCLCFKKSEARLIRDLLNAALPGGSLVAAWQPN